MSKHLNISSPLKQIKLNLLKMLIYSQIFIRNQIIAAPRHREMQIRTEYKLFHSGRNKELQHSRLFKKRAVSI